MLICKSQFSFERPSKSPASTDVFQNLIWRQTLFLRIPRFVCAHQDAQDISSFPVSHFALVEPLRQLDDNLLDSAARFNRRERNGCDGREGTDDEHGYEPIKRQTCVDMVLPYSSDFLCLSGLARLKIISEGYSANYV